MALSETKMRELLGEQTKNFVEQVQGCMAQLHEVKQEQDKNKTRVSDLEMRVGRVEEKQRGEGSLSTRAGTSCLGTNSTWLPRWVELKGFCYYSDKDKGILKN